MNPRFVSQLLPLVKAFEGCALSAYMDSSTPPVCTIGFGRTSDCGSPITMGMTCTQEQADTWLLEDLQAEGAHFIDAWVTITLMDNMYSALTSFIYNVGAGHFKRGVLPALNAGNYSAAVHLMSGFDTAGGAVLAGLTRRRAAEVALFNGDLVTMAKLIAE